jgi:hypothetical protein
MSGKIVRLRQASRLRSFRLTSRQWRIGPEGEEVEEKDEQVDTERVRGYQRKDLENAFERYLSPKSQRDSGTEPDLPEQIGDFDSVTPGRRPAVKNPQKSNNEGPCPTVTLSKGGNGQLGQKGLSEREIDEDAEWADEWRYQHRDEPDVDAILAQKLRERLRNKRHVFPENLEIEAERVMTRLFTPTSP